MGDIQKQATHAVEDVAERKKVVALMSAGRRTVPEIAKALGVGNSTVLRYRADPEVKKAIEEHRQLLRAENENAIAAVIPRAIQCVLDAIRDGDAQVALRFLEKCGAIQTAGRDMGMEQGASDGVAQIVVNIQQFGEPTTTIDVSNNATVGPDNGPEHSANDSQVAQPVVDTGLSAEGS